MSQTFAVGADSSFWPSMPVCVSRSDGHREMMMCSDGRAPCAMFKISQRTGESLI